MQLNKDDTGDREKQKFEWIKWKEKNKVEWFW